jgi:hypothetical protein
MMLPWSIMATHFFSRSARMNRSAWVAAKLPGLNVRVRPFERWGSDTIRKLAARHGVIPEGAQLKSA